jgi:hypothetical protein
MTSCPLSVPPALNVGSGNASYAAEIALDPISFIVGQMLPLEVLCQVANDLTRFSNGRLCSALSWLLVMKYRQRAVLRACFLAAAAIYVSVAGNPGLGYLPPRVSHTTRHYPMIANRAP